MEWREYTVWLDAEEAVDAVGDLLRELGSSGVVIKEPDKVYNDENFIEEWARVSKAYEAEAHKYIAVSGYFPPDSEIISTLTERLCVVETNLNVHTVVSQRILYDSYWQDVWKKYFRPQKIGKQLVVKPSWEEYKTDENMILLEIDPGLAFGTGLHPTTRFCLEFLEEYMPSKAAVLDAGTGSGILAIAAARLGANSVQAVELDEIAVKAATENVLKNRLEKVIHVVEEDVLQSLPVAAYDLILANLTADLIGFMAKDAYAGLRSGGIFIVSGIIFELWRVTKKKLSEAGFVLIKERTDDNWVAAVCQKKV